MKCDLHVHTIHSGMCTVPGFRRICRESYNQPARLYDALKLRGMDLVTVTDHDSIDAAEALRRHADFFLSEEVSCRTSRGTELHVGVYDITERDHIEMQRRSGDLTSLFPYLEERGLLYSINHVYSGLTGPRTEADFDEFAARFPAVETLNGQMLAIANRHAEAFAGRTRKIALAGSDSHTMASLGRTYTKVPGARTLREFLAGLNQGRAATEGESGNYWKLTRAVLEIACDLMRERRWTAVLAPLLAGVPLVILANLVRETSFAYHWGRRTARFHRPVPAACALERA
jgi:predicted metal-dependent phosphoesterase TrpH